MRLSQSIFTAATASFFLGSGVVGDQSPSVADTAARSIESPADSRFTLYGNTVMMRMPQKPSLTPALSTADHSNDVKVLSATTGVPVSSAGSMTDASISFQNSLTSIAPESMAPTLGVNGPAPPPGSAKNPSKTEHDLIHGHVYVDKFLDFPDAMIGVSIVLQQREKCIGDGGKLIGPDTVDRVGNQVVANVPCLFEKKGDGGDEEEPL